MNYLPNGTKPLNLKSETKNDKEEIEDSTSNDECLQAFLESFSVLDCKETAKCCIQSGVKMKAQETGDCASCQRNLSCGKHTAVKTIHTSSLIKADCKTDDYDKHIMSSSRKSTTQDFFQSEIKTQPQILSNEALIDKQFTLLDAVCRGDIHVVQYLLNVESIDPNFVLDLNNPICQATSLGNIQMMKILLDKGARPNTANTLDILWKRHPIHITASRGDLSAMQLLVENGANINQQDFDHRSPLHWIAVYGHTHMIKWMLDVGADVNMPQADGFTPLHTATCLGHREVCRMLIEGGANMFARDHEGWMPLHTSVCYGYTEIVKLLLEKGVNPLITNGLNEDSNLHLACSKGRLDLAELMLLNGVPIESRNSDGFTPLLTAIFYNRTNVVFELVRRGANVNAVNNAGTSPVSLAAIRCETELIKLLLYAGCKVKKQWSHQITKHSCPMSIEMKARSSVPQTLKEECLIIIRQRLAPNLPEYANVLPLPEPIKSELAMENLSAMFSLEL